MPRALVALHPARPAEHADLGRARSARRSRSSRFTIDISNFQQRRTVWMDGRPHPSALAEHTWMGFSTGRWEGDTLVVTTTHIKQMWHRRNGVPQSDQVTLTERFALHGTVMTYVTITDDPGLSDRAAGQDDQHAAATRARCSRSSCSIRALRSSRSPISRAAPCRTTCPARIRFSRSSRAEQKLPEEAARGGAATMYPEFQGRARRTP